MKSNKFVTAAVVIGAFLVSSQGFGAEQKTPMTRMTSPSAARLSPKAAIIPCPSELQNVQLSINAQYSAPSGWTAKTTPTGYQGQTLVISLHQVLGGKLSCSYGKNGSPSGYRLTTVTKPVPAGKTCTAIDGFRFSCQ